MHLKIVHSAITERDKVIEELKNRFIENWNKKPLKKRSSKKHLGPGAGKQNH